MKRIAKLNHRVSVGGQIYDKGTIVEVVGADDKRVKEKFPGMTSNPSSSFIGVIFPDRNDFTIGLSKSFTILN